MKRLGCLWVLLVGLVCLPFVSPAQLLTASASTKPLGVIQLDVDAQDAPRRLIHIHLTIPVSPGPLTLLYPQWIPGEHGPTGPIADMVNLRIGASGQVIFWKRDTNDLFAFHMTVPSGASVLDVSFDFISASDAVGFSSGSSMTTQLAVISWNQYLLYPQGVPVDQLQYRAKLRLPHDWHYGTALPVAKETGDEIEFPPVPLATLVDSPVAAGLHVRSIELGTVEGAPHFLHIIADSDRAISITPELIDHYKHLVAEAGALFGARHYRSYHFLLTLSDHVASFGLEHHESSDDRLEERLFSDENLLRVHADLLPHEYVHSWNGKYRRPSGLATKDYSEPMKGDLLWVYEGLTEYLGAVLATRSGFQPPGQFRDWLANLGGRLDHETGRAWRPLEDTAISAQILYGARDDYASLRRGVDFYGEAALVWLEVDTLIRRMSHETRSIDDFCKAFYGGSGGTPVVKPYTLEDLVAALNSVQPHDWAAFFRQRVERVEKRAPLAGIENGGWKLSYDDKRSDYWTAVEEEHKVADLTMSLGLIVKNEGLVQDVVMGAPAQKAGIAPGAQITSVNGRQFSASVLREAVQSAALASNNVSNDSAGGPPINVTVKNGEYVTTLTVHYQGGEKYPHLERERGKTDMLTIISQPRAAH